MTTGGAADSRLLVCCGGVGCADVAVFGMVSANHQSSRSPVALTTYVADLNFVRPQKSKSDAVGKGFVDRPEGAAQAWRANSQAFSANGRIISALAGANSLVAVPSRTRPMMPCKMAAIRKKL